MSDQFDFRDGLGLVPAHRHRNPGGTIGGWVADSATVTPTATVGYDTQVFGSALIEDCAQVLDFAIVFGNAHVGGNAEISGLAQISGFCYIKGPLRNNLYTLQRLFIPELTSGSLTSCFFETGCPTTWLPSEPISPQADAADPAAICSRFFAEFTSRS